MRKGKEKPRPERYGAGGGGGWRYSAKRVLGKRVATLHCVDH